MTTFVDTSGERFVSRPVVLVFLMVTIAGTVFLKQYLQPAIRLIGATALVTEVSSGLVMTARVDTGASACSIHCEKMDIEDAAPDPEDNVGKRVRFQIVNAEGQTGWIEARIVSLFRVVSPEYREERYAVRLNLRYLDVEQCVVVTLNDRSEMKQRLLLGRNFLRDGFLVDVSKNGSLEEDGFY